MEILEDRFCAPVTMHSMPVCTDRGGDIFDCIQKGDVEQCMLFVQNDRSILRHKGWGGFSPLHYAALHGNRSLVDFFLGAGADPNLTCDAGQTAFHFACRQGNIFNMHKMMQYGADLRLVDSQGKTSMHHAVTGGSIVAVHYLWETGMFRFSDADMYKVTPLHLAASTSNIDMICYLLKDQRWVVNAVDQQGATALHVAAERGGVELCWTLLQKTGCMVLHQKNYNGLTPLDLCKQGKTFRHQQLAKLLKRYINEPIHHKPRESNVLYYWTLFFPSLSGAAILLIAAMFGDYGGLICGLLFPWLARSISTQYYRMTSYQRLANPIYLGTLLAGMIHSLVCFYGKMMPNILKRGAIFKFLFTLQELNPKDFAVFFALGHFLLANSSKWERQENVSYNTLAQVSLIHFFILVSLFCKVLTQDPGVLDRADADPRFSCIADLVENNQSPHRFCPYCELFQPDYTKHCKLCEVCIKDYDHHCLFLNRCIGQGNHRLFLIFVLSMVTAHLLFIVSGISYLYGNMFEANPSFSQWLTLLGEEFWVVALMIMNALTLLWEAWLLTEQFDAISARTTTFFRHSEGAARQRSLGQRWAVVAAFLLEGRRSVGSRQIGEDKTAIDI